MISSMPVWRSLPQFILGRQKLKKSFQYEVKFRGMDHRVSTKTGTKGCS